MKLAAIQGAFLAQVLDEDAVEPPRWSARQRAGMNIYRNAYRARLVEAMEETFPAVKAWVGEAAFARAAAHHAILNPPSSWSLDHVGVGFEETLAQLFADDPEVSELGWLEWHMHSAFIARDAVPIDQAGFVAALAGAAPEEIARIGIVLMPGVATRIVTHDFAAIWNIAANGGGALDNYSLHHPKGLVIWREGLRSVFRMTCVDESECLAQDTFGGVCTLLAERRGDSAAVAEAGDMLARWVANGLIEKFVPEGRGPLCALRTPLRFV